MGILKPEGGGAGSWTRRFRGRYGPTAPGSPPREVGGEATFRSRWQSSGYFFQRERPGWFPLALVVACGLLFNRLGDHA